MSEGSEKEMSRSEKKDQEKLLYQDVMKYIMERAYRVDAEKNWKRTIRRKAGEFVLEDGQLYTKGDDRRRWVFDEEDQKRVTEACHDDKLDQGREFVNALNEKLFLLTGTEHRIASAYHPQTNGLDERKNQTVTKSLVKYNNADQDDWDEHLESVLFSYRTSVHATTKYTPFFLMYGREAVLPIQLHTSNVDNGHAIPEIESEAQRHAARLDTIRTETFMKVASNIENAQAKQKLYYDRKHAKAEFKLGSPVLLRNMRKLSRKGGKMDDEWTGPFTIAELKTYEERQIHEAASDLGQVHAGASDEEIASKIEQDFTASHNEESASKERLAIILTMKKSMAVKFLLVNCFMSNCFHHNCFDYGEQVPMNLHLIQQKMMMTLISTLRDFCGGQFVIMKEKLSEEFDHFRKHDINGSFHPVESLQLLECWFKSSGISIKTIIRYGKRYFLMSAANIDAFCQWVMETGKMYNKDGVVLDSLNLASKPDLNVCASGFIKLRPDNCTMNEAKVSMNDCDEEKQQSKKTSDEEKPIKKARKVRCHKQWMEVEDVKLYEEHRCILESNKWVVDVLINASQFLLHSQYGRLRFQATTLAYNKRFDVMREFIQILHNGDDHWVTISTIGLPSGLVNVFDSLYDTCNSFI
ncbi:hypothetical protein EMCRGX_G034973 [Ephydatia muelleri]